MKGCLNDNALAQANYEVIKTQFVKNKRFETLEYLGHELADYVNLYNNHRVHSSVGYLSPVDYR